MSHEKILLKYKFPFLFTRWFLASKLFLDGAKCRMKMRDAKLLLLPRLWLLPSPLSGQGSGIRLSKCHFWQEETGRKIKSKIENRPRLAFHTYYDDDGVVSCFSFISRQFSFFSLQNKWRDNNSEKERQEYWEYFSLKKVVSMFSLTYYLHAHCWS